MNRFLLVPILVLTAFLGTFNPAWAKDPKEPKEPREITVGGLFDLSGPTAALGKEYAQGAQDAAMFVNRGGGADGTPIRLLAGDFAYDQARSGRLYQDYRKEDHVFAILGWGRADVEALYRRVERDKVVYLAADYDAALADPRKSPYHFSIGVSLADQARLAMRYAKDQGGTKAAFILPDLPYALGPVKAGREYAEEIGLKIGPQIFVGLRAVDVAPQLAELAAFDPDFTWLGGTTVSTAAVLKEAARMRLRTRFLINTWGVEPDLVRLAGEAVAGRAWGFLPTRPFGWDVPETAHIKGVVGERQYSSLYHQGWASMIVLAEGLKRARLAGKLTGPGLKAALETLSDFETGGLTPPLTFTSGDHRPAAACGLYTFTGGKPSLAADVKIARNVKYLGW